jgi:hypothetical protein
MPVFRIFLIFGFGVMVRPSRVKNFMPECYFRVCFSTRIGGAGNHPSRRSSWICCSGIGRNWRRS